MGKRTRSSEPERTSKKAHKESQNETKYIKIATAEAAAAAQKETPLEKLTAALNNGVTSPAKGDAVVYWMRMEDLRST